MVLLMGILGGAILFKHEFFEILLAKVRRNIIDFPKITNAI